MDAVVKGVCATCRHARVYRNPVSETRVDEFIEGCNEDYRFTDKDDPERGMSADFPCRLWEGEE